MRKTFEVDTFKKFINDLLANKNISQEEKQGYCTALERVLFDTDNYHGYQNLGWLEFCRSGKGAMFTKDQYQETEEYSRWYY